MENNNGKIVEAEVIKTEPIANETPVNSQEAVSVQPAKDMSGTVIAAFVLGLCSILICSVCGPIGLYFSVKARKANMQSGLLTAGYVTSIIGTVLLGVVVLALFFICLFGYCTGIGGVVNTFN